MKQYQTLADSGVANLTQRSTLDVGGSTTDKVFAEAIFASMPTTVIQEKGLMRRYEVPGQTDIISVPVFKNFNLTFTNLSGTGSDTGSIAPVTAHNAVEYMEIQPVLKTAGLFLTETAELLTNKTSFAIHVQEIANGTARHFDQTLLNETVLSETAVGTAYVYSANGFVANGSVSAGSTLGPFDLSDAKASLSSGSDVYAPNVVVMHPTQYNQFLQSTDLRNDTYRVSDKATFVNGELVAYDGMQIVQTELVNGVVGSATTSYLTSGHPVAVFNKEKSAAYAEKPAAQRVRTWNDIRRHGTYIYTDVMFEGKVLIPESIRIIRCADA